MKHVKEKCGCTYAINGERQHWTELCPPHKAETEALHQRANVEHKAMMAARDAEVSSKEKRK